MKMFRYYLYVVLRDSKGTPIHTSRVPVTMDTQREDDESCERAIKMSGLFPTKLHCNIKMHCNGGEYDITDYHDQLLGWLDLDDIEEVADENE